MKDLMTQKERNIIKKREAIADALKQGKTYDEIKRELKTSTTTISSVVKLLERNGESWNK